MANRTTRSVTLIGIVLTARIKEAGLTAAAVAPKLGLSPAALRSRLNGKTQFKSEELSLLINWLIPNYSNTRYHHDIAKIVEMATLESITVIGDVTVEKDVLLSTKYGAEIKAKFKRQFAKNVYSKQDKKIANEFALKSK